MRSLIRIATIVGVISILALPAVAKGPSEATLSGPGIDGTIELFDHQTSSSTDAEAVSKLMEMSGIWFGRHAASRIEPPTDLGERLTITWGGHYDISQHIYLEAEGGPAIYTPEQDGLSGWGGDPVGWHRVDGDLEGVLADLGFHYSLYEPRPEWSIPFGLLAIGALIVVTYMIFRGSRRTGRETLRVLPAAD